ncbi:phage major capsid protein [Micromonospora sp. NPDC051227]|uniref:phage major capsid protein n=1 Tax=Micromonospora sp. NPDC051227 TaxID=3364285 RepID=UPI0037A2656D
MSIPTADELRRQIDVEHPTAEDLARVRTAMGQWASEIMASNRELGDREPMASEQRARTKLANDAYAVDNLIREIEAKLPMDPADRKIRFSQESDVAGQDPGKVGAGGRFGGDCGQALRTIDGMRNVPDEGRELLARAIDDAASLELVDELDQLSRYVVVASNPHYARAVGKLFRDPLNGHREFTTDELRAYQAAQAYQRTAARHERAMDSTVGSSGGFMLPTHLDPNVILTNAGVVDPMRLLARKALISTLVWNGVTSAGVTASWDAQNAQVSDDTPVLADASVPTHKGSAFVAASIETAQDTSIAGQLGEMFVDAKMRLEGTAFTTGSGTGEPTGVITTLGGSSQEVAPAVAETFGRADVIAVQEAVPARWRPNANFMAHLAMLNKMRDMPRLPSGTEVPLVDDSGPIPRARGWSIYENSGMDGAINPAATASNYVLLGGDFRQYLVVDRVGATVEYIPHLFGANGRPTGTRGWYMYWRTGGEVLVPDAFRLLDVVTTA